ncbi:diacylglycerol kinase family protein [Streptomyces sp. NBC_01565]|uniref:diacylglycerol kinase family protein n=1 Tax=unclassified Streptomyces TaxID=2593676 RepID=UPI002258BD1D|nr:diacylglycerol kinase family protein [Streptomyces sp. NBC_01565]MCX4539310.1 diacylglycerol kinase family protein [Streptomyces sp. NBC_01565]
MKTRRGAAARGARPLLFLLLLPVQAALLIAVGRLVTGPAAQHWPLAAEDQVPEALAQHRDAPVVTGVSEWISALGSTQVVVGLTLAALLALLCPPRVALRQEALFLGVAVAAQSAVFVLVTAFVERPRPDVPLLDAAPPTSSFPSGHVGASLALYGGLAVIAALRLRGPWRPVAMAALLLIPPAVGLARVYRGMHHPSDIAGGLLNGAATLLITALALLHGHRSPPGSEPHPDRLPHLPAQAAAAGTRGARTVLVVRHPYGCPDDLAERLRAVLDGHGHTSPEQRWIRTTAERPAGALAEEVAARRPALVVACGGDGTVRACAEVLAGTGIPLAVAPCGTGNLLARNLGLPLDPAAALDASLAGDSHPIDVGRVRGDGLPPTRFTVMAGVGFDAAMVKDASPRLKSRLGWAAYVLAALRHLRDPSVRLTIRVDGVRPRRRRARMVVIGNVGTLQGGLALLPGARPDSGHLDVVLFDPRGPAGWLAAAAHLVSRLLRRHPPARAGRAHTEAGGVLEYFTATRVDIRCARPQPRELDGDPVADGTRLTAWIEPGALHVHLPRTIAAGAREEEERHGNSSTRTAAPRRAR